MSSTLKDRKSTRLNSSHTVISYAVFCLKKKSTRLNSSHTVISYAVFCLKKNKDTFELPSSMALVSHLLREKKGQHDHSLATIYLVLKYSRLYIYVLCLRRSYIYYAHS